MSDPIVQRFGLHRVDDDAPSWVPRPQQWFASPVGAWTEHHAEVQSPQPLADTETYRLGAEYLADCTTVEDWGCGLGWFAKVYNDLLLAHRVPERWPILTAIDGSPSFAADVVVDLADYRSLTEGIFMRHVLEYNLGWQQIFDNALASFTERMFLVLSTPLSDWTHAIERHPELNVPVISFFIGDLAMHIDRVRDISWEYETLDTETIFRLEKI